LYGNTSRLINIKGDSRLSYFNLTIQLNKLIYYLSFALPTPQVAVHRLIPRPRISARLVGRLRVTWATSFPDGSFLGTSFDGSFPDFLKKLAVLRHADTLVFLWWFARKPLRSSPRKCDILVVFFGSWQPERPIPSWCVIRDQSDVNTSITLVYNSVWRECLTRRHIAQLTLRRVAKLARIFYTQCSKQYPF
jgi:hypothetical protein